MRSVTRVERAHHDGRAERLGGLAEAIGTRVERPEQVAGAGDADQPLAPGRRGDRQGEQARLDGGVRRRALADPVQRLARGDELARMIGARDAELASLRALGDATATVVLSDAPDVVLSVAGAVWTLEARLAANRAELAQLAAQQASVDEELARLSAAVARFETTVAGLERAVLRADAEVASLAAIEPTVAYVAQLAPAGARVLSDAAVPAMPEGRSTLLVALLAAVVVGFAGVVAALLAEAVRDPAA